MGNQLVGHLLSFGDLNLVGQNKDLIRRYLHEVEGIAGQVKVNTITVKGGGRSTSKNRSIKYVCPKCGAIIRATKQVNVVCGDCDVPFERA